MAIKLPVWKKRIEVSSHTQGDGSTVTQFQEQVVDANGRHVGADDIVNAINSAGAPDLFMLAFAARCAYEEALTPQAFGAKGDGIADDTEVFQRLLGLETEEAERARWENVVRSVLRATNREV